MPDLGRTTGLVALALLAGAIAFGGVTWARGSRAAPNDEVWDAGARAIQARVRELGLPSVAWLPGP